MKSNGYDDYQKVIAYGDRDVKYEITSVLLK